MAEAKCPDCGGKLGVKAVKCRCGWVMLGAPRDSNTPPVKVIACCFDGCPEGAICRIFTKTGWANVCRTHYPALAREAPGYAPRSLAAEETRKIYERSYHYRQKHGGRPVEPLQDRSGLEAELAEIKRKMEAQRQPGSDDDLPLGIERDPLEQDFLDKAQL